MNMRDILFIFLSHTVLIFFIIYRILCYQTVIKTIWKIVMLKSGIKERKPRGNIKLETDKKEEIIENQ